MLAPAPSAAPPCTTTFLGASMLDPNGWGTAQNWDHGVPVTGSVVCVPADKTVNHSTGVDSPAVLLVAGGLQLTGGTVSPSDTTNDSTVANYSQSGGTLGGSATVRVTTSMTWSGGSMIDAGTTAIGTGVTLTPTANITLTSGRTLEVAGTLDMAADRSIVHFNVMPRVHVTSVGQFRKTGGTGTSTVDTEVDNDGKILSQSGILDLTQGSGTAMSTGTFGAAAAAGSVRFSSGTQTLGDGAKLLDGSALTGGTLDVADASTATASGATISGGTLGGTGELSVAGPVTWSGGTMAGAGTTTIAAAQTLTQTGDVTLADGRTLEVAGTHDMTGDHSIFRAGAEPLVHVGATGLMKKSGGAGTGTVDAGLENDGTVRSTSGLLDLARGSGGGASSGSYGVASAVGTVRFTGGTHTLGDGAELLGGTELAGGTLDVADGATAEAPGLSAISGGTIDGTGTLDFTGATTWSGGTMTGAGMTAIGPTATLTQTGNVTLADARDLDITGKLDVAGDVSIAGSGAAAHITNSGSIVKSAGAGLGAIGAEVENDGTVRSQSGTLDLTGGSGGSGASDGSFGAASPAGTVRFNGGTQTLGDGAKLLGGVKLAGGALNVVDGGTASAPGLDAFSGGTIGGTGTFEITGATTWSGGTMSDAGTTSIAATGTLTQTGGATLAEGRALNVAGLYSLPADVALSVSGATPSVHVLNGGILRRGTSGGTAMIDAPVTSDGLMDLSRGVLSVAALTFGGTSTLKVGIAGAAPGTGFGRLSVGQPGALPLKGALQLDVGPAVTPAEGDQLTILTASHRTGCFSPVTGARAEGEPHYDVVYSTGGVTLKGRGAGTPLVPECYEPPGGNPPGGNPPGGNPPGGNPPPGDSSEPPMGIAHARNLTLDSRRRIPVRLTCASATGTCRGVIEVSARIQASRARKVVLGRARFSLGAGRTARVPVKLTKAGRRTLKGLRRLKVTVRVTGTANGVAMKPLRVTRTLRAR